MAITLDGSSGITTSSSLTTGSGAVYNGIASGTAVASTSGTSIDFTSIPSWAKRITVMFNGVSVSGTSPVLIQLGSGSLTTTGYLSTVSSTNTSAITNSLVTSGIATATSGVSAAASLMGGVINCVLLNSSSNLWAFNGMIANSNTAQQSFVSGSVPISGVVDRVRITATNGTDTFDAGSINILYE